DHLNTGNQVIAAWGSSLDVMGNVTALAAIFGIGAAAIYQLFKDVRWHNVYTTARDLKWSRAAIALLAVGSALSVRTLLAGPVSASAPSIGTMPLAAAATALQKPAVFAVAHLAFFGPLIMLAALCWASIAKHIRRSGPGMLMAAALVIALALDSETRVSSHSYGLLLPFIARGIDDDIRKLERPQFVLLVSALFVFGFGMSKIWFTVGDSVPRYLQMFGPWMTWDAYWVQASCSLLIGIAFSFLLKQSQVATKSAAEATARPRNSPQL